MTPADGVDSIYQGILADYHVRRSTSCRRELERCSDWNPSLVGLALSDSSDIPLAERIYTLRRSLEELPVRDEQLCLIYLYIYLACAERWESSRRYHEMRAVLSLIARQIPSQSLGGQDHNVATMQMVSRLGLALRCGFQLENALNCSCPMALRRWASRGSRYIDSILRLTPQATGLGTVIRTIATVQHSYFQANVTMATAVAAFVEMAPNARRELERAVDLIQSLEDAGELTGDVYASDLRSYRQTLAAMYDQCDWDHLMVDEGRLAYCYPFSLLGCSADSVEALLRSLPHDAELGISSVRSVSDLASIDAWELKDGKSGVQLELRSITVRDLTLCAEADHAVAIRVPKVGSPYLRLERRIDDVGVHTLYQALRRGTAQMGVEYVVSSGPERNRSDSLQNFAKSVVIDLLAYLTGRELSDEERTAVSSTVSRHQHTVLSIYAASTLSTEGKNQPIDSVRGLEKVVGLPLLYQRTSHVAATLDEYVRLPLSGVRTEMHDIDLVGETLIRTGELTVLAMPTTPTYLTFGYEEMAEFAAGVPALIEEWGDTVAALRIQLLKDLERLEDAWNRHNTGTKTLHAPTYNISDLESLQFELEAVIASARTSLATIRSPRLIQTGKYREVLDRLLEGSYLDRLERDFEGRVAEVQALYLRLGALSSRLDERTRRSYRLAVEVSLAVLGVLSLSELATLINGAFGLGLLASRVEVLMILSTGVLLAALSVIASRRS